MAAYPALIQVYGSTPKDDGGVSIARTVSGILKIRSFYTADVRQFTILHEVDAAEKGTLDAFYATNRKLIFDFTWSADVQVYSCRFLGPVQYTPIPSDRWKVSVTMEVV